jgi:acyl-CoA hydrolase
VSCPLLCFLKGNLLKRISKSPAYVENIELVLPPDTNHHGTVFGGRVLQWIDITAAITAQRFAGHKVVTASIDQMHFILPIELGHVVILKSCVNCVHETSMEIGVRVEREDASTGAIDHAATAYLTFVAMDDDMIPVQVPHLLTETPAEHRRVAEAHLRRESRLKHRQALLARRQQGQ